MRSRILTAVLLFLALAVSPLFSQYLQLQGKKIALSFDEHSLCFYVENPSPESGDPRYLLFRDDPPTSYLSLSLNDRIYRFTEQQVKEVEPFTLKENSIEGVYRIANMEYRIRFRLTNLSGRENDSILITVSTRGGNGGDRAGARFLFDTVWGEDAAKPRLTVSSTEPIQYERIFQGDTVGNFILSGIWDSESTNFGRGLFIYPWVNQIHQQSVFFGNWKRLDSAEGAYKFDQDGRFRYNPYSQPDAAVAVFHSVPVREQETVTFGCLLSRSYLRFQSLTAPVIQTSAPLYPAATDTTTISASSAVKAASVSATSAPTGAAVTPASSSSSPGQTAADSSQRPVLFTAASSVSAAALPDAAASNTAVITGASYAAASSTGAAVTSADSVRDRELALLASQADAIEKLTRLLDRIDSNLSASAPDKRIRTVGASQGLTSISGSRADSTEQPPFRQSNISSQGTQASTVIASQSSAPQVIWISNAPPQLVVVTNDLSSEQMERLRQEFAGREKEYNDKIAQLTQYYQDEILKKESEFKRISDGYQEASDSKEKKKERDRRLREIDATMQDLNARILVLERLLGLDLDFQSMPESQLREITAMIDGLSQKLK